MPHISITLYKGRDEETLKGMAEKVQAALAESCPASALSVSVKEVEPNDFVSSVDAMIESGDKLMIASDFYK